MHVRTRDLKAMAESVLDEYDEAMIDNLRTIMSEALNGLTVDEIDEDLWIGIYQNWIKEDQDEWAINQVYSSMETEEDNRYQMMKDER